MRPDFASEKRARQAAPLRFPEGPPLSKGENGTNLSLGYWSLVYSQYSDKLELSFNEQQLLD
jgi:hypothetical protein